MLKQELVDTNLTTLVQVTELVTKVIKSIAGDNISNTVQGQLFSSNDIRHAVAAKLQSNFMVVKKGVNK